jgi:uncharacterized repeat protein (TIGR01451 family)
MRLTSNRLEGSVPAALCAQILAQVASPGCPSGELTLTYNKLEVWEPEVLTCLANLWGTNWRLGLERQLVLPDRLALENVSSSNATVGWTPLDWPEILTYTVEYGAEGATQVITARGKVYNTDLTNLQPETSYSVSVRATAAPGVLGFEETSSRPIFMSFATTAPPAPIVFSKSVTPTIALPGALVTYTLSAVSASGATNVVVSDSLPVSVTFVDGSLTGPARYPGDGNIEGIFSTLKPGEPSSIEYQGRIDAAAGPGSVLFSSAEAKDGADKYIASAGVSVKTAPADILLLIYANGDNSLDEHVRELFQKAEAGLYEAQNGRTGPGTNVQVAILYDGAGGDNAYLYRLKSDANQQEYCPVIDNPSCGGRYVESVDRWKWGENIGTYATASAARRSIWSI